MQEIAEKVGHSPTIEEMNDHGEFSVDPHFRVFGSWVAAYDTAKLDERSWRPKRASKSELPEEIRKMAEQVGHAPPCAEMKEHGRYSYQPFVQAFGSWSAALEAAGFSFYRQPHIDGEPQGYGSHWPEQRRRTMERDGWKCQDCGMTDEEHREGDSCGLHVHHKTPLREFEGSEAANRLENLITLCRACHSDRELESYCGGYVVDNKSRK